MALGISSSILPTTFIPLSFGSSSTHFSGWDSSSSSFSSFPAFSFLGFSTSLAADMLLIKISSSSSFCLCRSSCSESMIIFPACFLPIVRLLASSLSIADEANSLESMENCSSDILELGLSSTSKPLSARKSNMVFLPIFSFLDTWLSLIDLSLLID